MGTSIKEQSEANDILSILHAEAMRTSRNAEIPETFFG